MLVGDNATIDEARLRNDHGPQQRSDLQRGRQEHVARALPATERNPRTTAPAFCALGGELDTVAAHLDTADFDAVRCGPDNLLFRSSTAMFGRCRIMLHNNVFQSLTRSADPAGTGSVRLFRHADYRALSQPPVGNPDAAWSLESSTRAEARRLGTGRPSPAVTTVGTLRHSESVY